MISAILEDGVALASTLTASTNTTELSGQDQHVLMLEWTPGTAANVLSIEVQTRCKINGTNTTWTQDMEWSAAAGTKTKTDNTYTFTAADTNAVGLRIALPAGGDELRIRHKESEAGSSTKGTLKAKVYSYIS